MLESNSFLRPIPEDTSDTASRKSSQPNGGFVLPTPAIVPMRGPASDAGSSVRAIQAGRAGSIMSGSSVGGVIPMQNVSDSSSNPPDKKRAWYLRTNFLVSSFVVLLILLAVLLIVVLDVGRQTEEVVPITGDLGAEPSSSPTVDVAAKLDEVLLQITNQEDLYTEGTPQNSARLWMLGEDLLRGDVLLDGPSHIIQRYVLTTLFFSTGGGSFLWDSTRGAVLNDQFECDWPGISCDAASNAVNVINYTSTGLIGRLPTELGQLSTLQELDLSRNSISENVPQVWFGPDSKLQNLYYLDLSHNKLSGVIPRRVWELPVLRFLYLSNNNFRGQLIRREGQQTSQFLEAIWLDENQLTGEIPAWLSEVVTLESFFAYNNSLTGPLPNVQGLTRLKFFDLSFNKLTGTISSTLLYDLPEIRKIFLDYNSLDGVLPSPPVLGNSTEPTVSSTKVRKLWIQGNRFSGELPADFGIGWQLLEHLLVFENPELSGSITNCTSKWPQSSRIEADCAVTEGSTLTPPVVCNCCTRCHSVAD